MSVIAFPSAAAFPGATVFPGSASPAVAAIYPAAPSGYIRT